jgi:hypothetical protein
MNDTTRDIFRTLEVVVGLTLVIVAVTETIWPLWVFLLGLFVLWDAAADVEKEKTELRFKKQRMEMARAYRLLDERIKTLEEET